MKLRKKDLTTGPFPKKRKKKEGMGQKQSTTGIRWWSLTQLLTSRRMA
jgi:hypothetical protein